MNLFVQDDDLLDQKRLLFSYNKFIYLNTLSQEGGVVATPPFRIFPRAIFAFLLRLPYSQFTHPLSRYPYIYEKIFQKFLP